MNTTTLPGTEVDAFAAAVRTALADLPPDDLDELTDGLEADLAERVDESGADLGDPAAYAEELRAAAGYPPRSARTHLGDALPDLRTLPQEIRRRWKGTIQSRPIVASIAAFFVALRPVWWVLRGLVLWVLIAGMLGRGTNLWPIAVVLVVFSVVLGRGWMSGRGWVRWILRVVSAVAIIAAPFVLAWGVAQWNNGYYAFNYMVEDGGYDPGLGLTQNGQQVDNIFAFDAEGKPIDQVQLFDQNGKPLNITVDTSAAWWDAQDGSMLVPSGEVPGRAGWNVYPLAHVNDWSDYEDDGQIDDSEIAKTDFPLYLVKPLAGHEAPSTPTSGEGASSTQSGSPAN
jgi:hypothetical protein